MKNYQTYFFIISFFVSLHAGGQEDHCFHQKKDVSAWEYIGPFLNEAQSRDQFLGRIISISANPSDTNEIYAGAATAGLFYTRDQGKNWTCLTDHYHMPVIGVTGVAVDYSKSPRHIVISIGTVTGWFSSSNIGILKSTDGGKNWKPVLSSPEGHLFMKEMNALHSEEGKLWALTQNEVFVSHDFGDTWKIFLNNRHTLRNGPMEKETLLDFILNRKSGKSLFTTRHRWENGVIRPEVYMANARGRNIVNITDDFQFEKYVHGAAKNPSSIGITQANPNAGTVYVTAAFEQPGFVVISEYDPAKRKILRTFVPNNRRFDLDQFWYYGLFIHPKHPDLAYAAGTVFYKANRDLSDFKIMYPYSYGGADVPHADIRNILHQSRTENEKEDYVYLATDGGISFSSNGGEHFRNITGTRMEITQNFGFDVSPFTGAISAGSQDNSIATYFPGQKRWIFSNRGDGYDVAYSKQRPGRVYGQYNGLVIFKAEADTVPFIQGVGNHIQYAASNRQSLKTLDNGCLYFSGKDFYVIHDTAARWEKFPSPVPDKTLAFDVCESDPNVIFISGFWSGLWKSDQGGKTWTEIHGMIDNRGFGQKEIWNGRISAICIHPENANEIWIGYDYPENYDDLCAPTQRIAHSTDGGRTWFNDSKGLPIFPVTDIQYYKGMGALFASTYNGVYYKKINEDQWYHFSDGLPKALFTELQISYCRGKIIASSYGRGIWESDLPEFEHRNRRMIYGREVFSVPDTAGALYETKDLELDKHAELQINCTLHLPKNGKIFVHKRDQVTFGPKGKILNECGEDIRGIVLIDQ